MKHTHLRTGISDSDWFACALNESKADPVGLWQMEKAGRGGFGLDGVDLDDFVERFVLALVEGGAEPIKGDRSSPSGWSRCAEYSGSANDIAALISLEWKRAGRSADVDGVWFAFPGAWEEGC